MLDIERNVLDSGTGPVRWTAPSPIIGVDGAPVVLVQRGEDRPARQRRNTLTFALPRRAMADRVRRIYRSRGVHGGDPIADGREAW